ncbi:MAG: hypothetical protein ACTHJ1_00200 [Bordetella sp.]|uniref:hypothetical protein n=1 Tax=Bordetella sp. TaxID=28081 RepID=UPI003F7CC870
MTVSLNTYRDVASLGTNVRFKLDEQTELRSDGRRNIGNIFSRAWDCITRSDAQVASNKAVAQDFVQALREKYGDEIANTMSRDLSAQLSKGRPLTGYRIQQVMEKAERMSNNIQANNRQLLGECLSELTDSALSRLGGKAQGLTRQVAAFAIQTAISESPEFREHGFKNALHIIMNEFGDDGDGFARQQFLEHFQDRALKTLECRLLISDLPLEKSVQLDVDHMTTSKGTMQDVRDRLGENGFDEEDLAWIHQQGMHVGDTVMRFSPEQIALLKSRDLTIELGLQYLDKGIPIHERTLVGAYTDGQVHGEPRALSGGAVSKPYDVTYGERRMVYKEPQFNPKTGAESGYGPSSKLLGIDAERPQMTVRNVATKAVDELLGFNLVPETGIGVLGGKVGLVMGYAEGITPRYDEDVNTTAEMWPTIGMMLAMHDDPLQAIKDGNPEALSTLKDVLEASESRYELNVDITDSDIGQRILALSTGTPQEQEKAQEILGKMLGRIEDGHVIQDLRITATRQRSDDVNFEDPVVRRELVKLQLLDALTAQGDRHQANYILRHDDQGRCTGLVAIDNDQAFGPSITNPNDLLFSVMQGRGVEGPDGVTRPGTEGLNGVMLPGVVDREMKAAFDGITPENLRASLAGLLPAAEIDAAVQRLDVIKTHLAKLEREGKIIEPGEWGGAQATTALQGRFDSYVGRDRAYAGTLREHEDTDRQNLEDLFRV